MGEGGGEEWKKVTACPVSADDIFPKIVLIRIVRTNPWLPPRGLVAPLTGCSKPLLSVGGDSTIDIFSQLWSFTLSQS